MEESNFMMALFIIGLSSPSKDFDIFMEPLVEDEGPIRRPERGGVNGSR
jgi:hypothetical protein